MTDDDRMFRITTDRDDLLFVRGLDEANEAAENLICEPDVLWVQTEPCEAAMRTPRLPALVGIQGAA